MSARPDSVSVEGQLRGWARREGSRLTLTLVGELDVAAAPAIDGQVRSVLRAGATSVVLDISALTFIDCRGLSCLLGVREACERHGARLTIRDGAPLVRRVMGLTGVDVVLEVEAGPEAIGSAARAPG